MRVLSLIYKIARGILFSAILLFVAVYLSLYILLSVPAMQNKIKIAAQNELTTFLGGEVAIGRLTIKPFNEVVLNDLEVFTPEGRLCLKVNTFGVGINLWRLLNERQIELTYAEVLGMNVNLWQPEEGAPLNVAFIIDAFKPKDKTSPPARFDLKLRNVVLRRCALSFDKEWMPMAQNEDRTDFNHFQLTDLKGDINLPRISNDEYLVDLRRLSFKLSGGLDLEKLSFKARVTPESINVNNLIVKLPFTELRPSDISLSFKNWDEMKNMLNSTHHEVVMVDNTINPADFGWLCPVLRQFPVSLQLNLEAEGSLSEVSVRRLSLDSGDDFLRFELKAEGDNLCDKGKIRFNIDDLKADFSKNLLESVVATGVIGGEEARDLFSKLGAITLSATGSAYPHKGIYQTDCRISTDLGDMFVSAETDNFNKNGGFVKGDLSVESFDLGQLWEKIRKLNSIDMDIAFEGKISGKDGEGNIDVRVAEFRYDDLLYSGFELEAAKTGKELEAQGIFHNEILTGEINLSGSIDGADSNLQLTGDIDQFRFTPLGLMKKYKDPEISGDIRLDISGNTIDNLQGELALTGILFKTKEKKELSLGDMYLITGFEDSIRSFSIHSMLLNGEVCGKYSVTDIVKESESVIRRIFPEFLSLSDDGARFSSELNFDFRVQPDNNFSDFFNLPFRFPVPVKMEGSIKRDSNTATLSVTTPYLQQGKNKLIRDTALKLTIDGNNNILTFDGGMIYPAKKGEVNLNLQLSAMDDRISTDVRWFSMGDSQFKGVLNLGALLGRNEYTGNPEISLDINPSGFDFGAAHWNIDKGNIHYIDKNIEIDGLKIWHDSQLVEIGGIASTSSDDSMKVKLASIDLDYIFDTLNINYVTFGGEATGNFMAMGAFSDNPVAYTDDLNVKNMSYNGTVLGDGMVRSRWNNREKEVEIDAEIMGENNRLTRVNGGIWVTKDSLSFDISTERAPVGFMKPFMQAFTSEVEGYASGKVKLFGSFSDIDLIGRVYADSLALKIDYTNVTYHGRDSVYLEPGRIVIPSFRLYDREGNSAILTGNLTHRYFHDPRFNFRVSDAQGLLCYDTNAKLNPDWFGTLYGNGSASVNGYPGVVSISVDMTTVGNSSFTFVLNETQAAEDYKFLTFSDKKKDRRQEEISDTLPAAIAALRKKIEVAEDLPTDIRMDIRGSITPTTLMTLVMDPVAGDKITARGNGNIQVNYNSENNEMQMFGKYVLDEGNYNFSLQDLILRDFNIRQGSNISFNGDPFNALLDITASYRVNTNLSDLDKSFSTDRELTRTNVPVDAMLKVEGQMQHPEISFDIELPTLTQDMERKVKSIISTDDMMSRQIIYLLALNRFYTPEYMGSTSNGGELASVASSTLSSQLSNILGQLTDKFTVAPSFRSDKGDFSDLEVDVALSSRLLNNRLLINGNFGYRDKATSQTTFVGDFDIEYLLSRRGNLRLKAYNHFNDQNYYLRQALTTQGLGVIFSRDFDNPFSRWRQNRLNKKGEKKKEDSSTGIPVTDPVNDKSDNR